MALNPLICGRWDGVHLWLQWEPADGAESGFEIEARFARPQCSGEAEPRWEPWRPIGRTSLQLQGWMMFPTWKQGWLAQARVRIASPARTKGAGEDGWELAQEAEFLQSECDFEISSVQKRLYFPLDPHGVAAVFISTVDGAACAYELRQELEVSPGEAKNVTLRAHFQNGFSQLDHEDHFDLRPSLGVRIRNLGPSRNNLRLTGQHFTKIEPGPKQALVVAFGASHFQGAAQSAQLA